MNLFFVTHSEPERTCGDNDLVFVRVAGRLIPLTRSAIDRLVSPADRETTAARAPKRAARPAAR